jgi:hypothetical protein
MDRKYDLTELTMAVTEYRKQHTQLVEQLRMLDEERNQSIKTLDMLSGAIAALDALIGSPAPEAPQEASSVSDEDEF